MTINSDVKQFKITFSTEPLLNGFQRNYWNPLHLDYFKIKIAIFFSLQSPEDQKSNCFKGRCTNVIDYFYVNRRREKNWECVQHFLALVVKGYLETVFWQFFTQRQRFWLFFSNQIINIERDKIFLINKYWHLRTFAYVLI